MLSECVGYSRSTAHRENWLAFVIEAGAYGVFKNHQGKQELIRKNKFDLTKKTVLIKVRDKIQETYQVEFLKEFHQKVWATKRTFNRGTKIWVNKKYVLVILASEWRQRWDFQFY